MVIKLEVFLEDDKNLKSSNIVKWFIPNLCKNLIY